MGRIGKTFAFVLILVVAISSMSLLVVKPASAQTKTIIVPDDYSTIQAAINASNAGDTIYVKNGTYFETLVIDKPLIVIGESRTNTIVNANRALTDIVRILSANVTFAGFAVENCGGYVNEPITQPNGIVLESGGHCNISDNILAYIPYGAGIYIGNPLGSISNPSIDNTIEGNYISAGSISVNSGYDNLIAGNVILHGAGLDGGSNNRIIGNYFTTSHSSIGLEIDASSNNTIVNNTIAFNRVGIAVGGYGQVTGGSNAGSYYSENNTIYYNEFVDNEQQTLVPSFSEYGGSVQLASLTNYWNYQGKGNYWSDYLTRYPNTSEIDSTGIGNTSYALYGNGVKDIVYFDNYPLMRPFNNETIVQPSPFPTLSPFKNTQEFVGLAILLLLLFFAVSLLLLFRKHRKTTNLSEYL